MFVFFLCSDTEDLAFVRPRLDGDDLAHGRESARADLFVLANDRADARNANGTDDVAVVPGLERDLLVGLLKHWGRMHGSGNSWCGARAGSSSRAVPPFSELHQRQLRASGNGRLRLRSPLSFCCDLHCAGQPCVSPIWASAWGSLMFRARQSSRVTC